jgi:lauroyl/myristoyl acyltransferase
LVFGLLAGVLAALPLNPSRVALRNLRERMGLVGWGARVVLFKLYLNYGLYALEVLVYWPLQALIEPNRSDYFAFLDDVDKAFALETRGVGVAFIAGHYAAIEQVGWTTNAWLRSRGHSSLAVLAKPSKVRLFSWFLDVYRMLRGFDMIWTSGGSKTMWQAMTSAVLSGKSLGMISDQKPRVGGVFVEFFGAPAAFPFRGIAFALDHGMPCVATNARRIMPGWFRTEFALMPFEGTEEEVGPNAGATAMGPKWTPLRVVDPAAYERALATPSFVYLAATMCSEVSPVGGVASGGERPSVRLTIAHFAGWLEGLIRLSPYQWSWDYRKWSRGLAKQSDKGQVPAGEEA